MRVLQVLHSHGVGGAEMHALQLMRALRALDVACEAAVPDDGWLADTLRGDGFVVHPVAMHGMYDPLSMLAIARAARRARVDVVHGHLMRGARYAGIGARLAGLRSVATAHSTNTHRWLRGVDAIIPVSAAVHDNLASRGYAAPALRAPVPNGVPAPDLLPRDEARRALGVPADWPDDAPLIGLVGRFLADKGQDVAIEALARMRAAGSDARLVFIGPDDGPWARKQVESVARMTLGDRVLFAGTRAPASAYARAFDVVWIPSRREALSLVALENAAAARPVIASDVGGLPEVVAHGDSGLLVPPADPEALARETMTLLADPARRSAMGSAAQARWRERFTAERMAERTLAVYRSTLSPGPEAGSERRPA